MSRSRKANEIVAQLTPGIKLGELKKLAKEIKRDHDLALELWSTKRFLPRMLAVLIMDKKLLSQEFIDQLASDVMAHGPDEKNQLVDWLLANQLMRDRAAIALMQSWERHQSPILRRLFWYHQARLRWTGQTPPDNTAALMDSLEKKLLKDEPEVQWAMNFCAGQIGIRQPEFRARSIKLGETTALYKDAPVARGCTPNYLPEFIRIEVSKLEERKR